MQNRQVVKQVVRQQIASMKQSFTKVQTEARIAKMVLNPDTFASKMDITMNRTKGEKIAQHLSSMQSCNRNVECVYCNSGIQAEVI